MSKLILLCKIADHMKFRNWQIRSVIIRSRIGHIGKGCIVNPESTLIEKNIFMDDYSIIQNGVNFISNKGKLILGKYSVLASGCTLIPEYHKLIVGIPFSTLANNHIGDKVGDIIIKEDCWLGANSIVIGNRVIGRGAVVGAGSIVTKNVPPYAVVAGSPARIIAVKFSKENIKKHEEVLYSPNERMTKEEIDELFKNIYDGVKICGLSETN